MQPKDIALAPIYLYQGRKLRRNALRLPEAQGERQGSILLSSSDIDPSNLTTKTPKVLNIMMVGDSSAAGVGVNHQEDALLGHLLYALQDMPAVNTQFTQIDWALHATSGHTSFDILRRLYVLPSPEETIDIAIVMVGVNDTTANVSTAKWQTQLMQIIALLKRKFSATHIVFPTLPPMEHMPAIPRPLNTFIGARAESRNTELKQVCEAFEYVSTVAVDFSEMGLTVQELFSEDGFHPNSQAYAFWAAKLANHIVKQL